MQTDSKDLHVHPKLRDVYAIKIQGPGCFATRNLPVVIYVMTCYKWFFNLAHSKILLCKKKYLEKYY